MSWLYSNDYSVRVPRRHAWMHGRRTATAVPPRQLRDDVVRKTRVPNGLRGAGTAALEEARRGPVGQFSGPGDCRSFLWGRM